MQDILDFVNGGNADSREVTSSELEALLKLGVKPISRDAFATCVLVATGNEALGQKVYDDVSFDAVIPDNCGKRVLFVRYRGHIPIFESYCGDALQVALKEKYQVEISLPSIIRV